jgi:hypothetical protein
MFKWSSFCKTKSNQSLHLLNTPAASYPSERCRKHKLARHSAFVWLRGVAERKAVPVRHGSQRCDLGSPTSGPSAFSLIESGSWPVRCVRRSLARAHICRWLVTVRQGISCPRMAKMSSGSSPRVQRFIGASRICSAVGAELTGQSSCQRLAMMYFLLNKAGEKCGKNY